MIVSHRTCELPGRGAHLRTHAIFSELFRVHAVDNDGVVSDDRLSTLSFARVGKIGRPVVTVVLDGVARVEAFSRSAWIEPGQVSVVQAKGGILMRQSRARERYRALVMEWEPRSPTERPEGFRVLRLPGDDLATIQAAADMVTRSEEAGDDVSRALIATASTLAERGTPIRVPGREDFDEEPAASSVRLSRGLDHMLSEMGSRPMIVDLHERLGVSARTANRLVRDFNARYGFNASTWQDTRSPGASS